MRTRQTKYNRQDPESPMEDYQEQIVEDEPLKVLEIFPKRPTSSLQLNLNTIHRMYLALTCTLCQKLLKAPVYLKCSHRFCKECIEKYIRNNTKKTCPNCRGELSTKRQLRTDKATQKIIQYSFKDPKIFSSSFEQAEQPLMRSRSGIDFRKNDNYSNQLSESEVIVPSIKRTRTEGEALPQPSTRGRKKRVISEKKLQSKMQIQHDNESSTIQRRKSKKTEQKQAKKMEALKPSPVKAQAQTPALIIQNFHQEYISKERVKKKKIPIIDLASESEQMPEQDIQQIRKEQFVRVQDKNVTSINFLPQDQQSQPQPMTFKDFTQLGKAEPKTSKNNQISGVSKKTFAKQIDYSQRQKTKPIEIQLEQKKEFNIQKKTEVQRQTKLSDQEQVDNRNQDDMVPEPEVMIPEPEQNIIEEPPPKISEQTLKAIELLKSQFNEEYPQKIIQLSPFSFYVSITLTKLAQSILIPEDVGGTYKICLKSSISSVASLVGQFLNLDKEFIRLFVKQDEQVVEVSHKLKLYEVNGQYWKHWRGVQLLETSQLIQQQSKRELEVTIANNIIISSIERTLFYSINIQKLLN